jgi:hypothetical protein
MRTTQKPEGLATPGKTDKSVSQPFGAARRRMLFHPGSFRQKFRRDYALREAK